MTGKEKSCWHWFLSIPVSYLGQRKLLEYYGTPENVKKAPEEKVIEIIGRQRPGIECLKESKHKDWEKEYEEIGRAHV